MNDGLVKLNGVTFGYRPERPILRDFSFSLGHGERVVVTGPNGAGKTTLLHIIMGLLKPNKGQIEILGRVRRWEEDFVDVRRRIGLLFQDSDSQLFSPTVFDDVAFGPLNLGWSEEKTRVAVRETLAALDLSALEECITYQLSHGQKRLVALATIMAMKPSVLLLDEPTSGLDSAHEARLADILQNLSEEMLIVSHNRPFIESVATRVVHIADGRLTEEEFIARR